MISLNFKKYHKHLFTSLVLLIWILDVVPLAKADKIKDTREVLLTHFDDCQYLAHLHQPQDVQGTHLGLCVHEHTETRGIFSATACVMNLIEPETKTRDPFYGKNGHWGYEGSCKAKRFVREIKKAQTQTTVNPITNLYDLIKQGYVYETIKDYGLVGHTIETMLAAKAKQEASRENSETKPESANPDSPQAQ